MASQCPTGVNCTYKRGPSLAPLVLPIYVLAVFAVAARIYSRRLVRQSISASEFTIFAGLLLSASLTGMVLYSEHQVLGRRLYYES